MGSWKGRENQYIQFVRVLYCKLPTNGKQLPAFPLEAVAGTKPGPQMWEARVLPLCHSGPLLRFRILLYGEIKQYKIPIRFRIDWAGGDHNPLLSAYKYQPYADGEYIYKINLINKAFNLNWMHYTS